jgi:hypothetical protein
MYRAVPNRGGGDFAEAARVLGRAGRAAHSNKERNDRYCHRQKTRGDAHRQGIDDHN